MKQSLTQAQMEWAARVARWKESKLERDEFAAKEGVSGKRLAWWWWRLRKLGALPLEVAASSGPSFVRLETPGPTAGIEGAEPLELILGGGQRMRIPVGFDAGTLTRVLAIIARGEA